MSNIKPTDTRVTSGKEISPEGYLELSLLPVRLKTVLLKNHRGFLLLWGGFLSLLFLIQGLVFLLNDGSLTDGDSLKNIMTSCGIYNNSGFSWSFPPLTFIVTHLFYILLGFSLSSLWVGHLMWGIAFIMALCLLGYQYGGRITAMGVSLLGLASPWLLLFSREYGVALPSAVMISFTFYFLLKSDNFNNRKYSILSGIFLALCLFTGEQTLLFLLLPFLWFILPQIGNLKIEKTDIKNLTGRKLDLYIPVLKNYQPILKPALFTLAVLLFLLWRIKASFTAVSPPWLFYIFNLFLPGTVLMFLSRYLYNRHYGDQGEKLKIRIHAFLNFLHSLIIAILLSTPWYAYVRYMGYSGGESSWTDTSLLLPLGCSCYSFCLFFVIIGVVMIFLHRDNLYLNLLLPANILFVLWLFAIPGIPFSPSRLFPLVVFVALLGGLWFKYPDELHKKIIISLVGIISLVNLFGWMMIPHRSPFLLPVHPSSRFMRVPFVVLHPLTVPPVSEEGYYLSPVAQFVSKHGKDKKFAFINLTSSKNKSSLIADNIMKELLYQRFPSSSFTQISTEDNQQMNYIFIYQKDNFDSMSDMKELIQRIYSSTGKKNIRYNRVFDIGENYGVGVIIFR